MSNQGSDVLEANNRSVKIAKRALSITERNLQTAKNALEVARKNVEVAQKEFDQAKKYLNRADQARTAAHKKYEVVDLMKDGSGDKNRKSSSSKKRCTAASDDLHTKKMKYNADVPQVILGKENVLSEASGVKVNGLNIDPILPEGVLITGCGLAQVNGFYMSDGRCHGLPKYTKIGQWKGKDARLVLRVSRGSNREWWYVGIWNSISFYKAKAKSSEPPTDGWEVLNPHGVEPPPKITFIKGEMKL